MTDSELLAKVEASLDYLLTGNVQSYAIADRELMRLPLPELYKMRTDLKSNVARASTGLFVVAGVRRPR